MSNYTSRITKIRIINFECLKDVTLEFDERGVIIPKGYNDSGKSAIAQAIKVLIYNWKPRLQSDYIQDGKSYFRIIMYFDDGIIILRDKYLAGASLYNMYKDVVDDEHLVYSSSRDGVYIAFDDVPEPIAKYLGVISVDNMYLNARDSDDPLLLVHTTGSDNYKFLSEVLHSDELALAARLLNTDKNKKQSDINDMSSTVTVYRKEYNSLYGITENLVEEIERLDNSLSDQEKKLKIIEVIDNYNTEMNSITILPILESLDGKRFETLGNILSNLEELEVQIAPTLLAIEGDGLSCITSLLEAISEMEDITILPILEAIEPNRLIELEKLSSMTLDVKTANALIKEDETRKEKYLKELDELNDRLKVSGFTTVKCDNCGNIITLEG